MVVNQKYGRKQHKKKTNLKVIVWEENEFKMKEVKREWLMLIILSQEVKF